MYSVYSIMNQQTVIYNDKITFGKNVPFVYDEKPERIS